MNNRSHDTAENRDADCLVSKVDDLAVERVRAAMRPDSTVSAMSDIFSALSDPTRLRILTALAESELCVCDIAAVTGSTSSAVSHQLRVLRDRGLATFRRDGKRAVYRLADDHVRTLLEQAVDHALEGAG